MSDHFEAGTTTVTGAGDEQIEAYAATALAERRHGGVVVIHHMPGCDEASKEITRRFGAWGYASLCPNLHHRDAPGAAPDDAAAAVRRAGGVPDERMLGDVAGAVAQLRARPTSNGQVAVIGFCSGGRQAMLAAAALDIDAVVDCYGAFVLNPPPSEHGLSMGSLRDRVGEINCPVLGLFGGEDRFPSPEEVAELDQLLSAAGTEHQFHTFEDAGHAFFAVDRASYRVAAAVEGWALVREFLRTHLGDPTSAAAGAQGRS